MLSEAKRLGLDDRPAVMQLVNSIYEHLSVEELADKGYPDLRVTPNSPNEVNTFDYRKKNYPLQQDSNADFVARSIYFSRYLSEPTPGIPKKVTYGIMNADGELTSVMGVSISDYWPTWVVNWVLNSPKHEISVADSVKIFYSIIELYKSHGIHEATWVMPKHRLRAWMRIKQTMENLVTELGMPLNEYEHMTEYVVPANTIPQYSFMSSLVGNRTHTYDLYIRRIKFK